MTQYQVLARKYRSQTFADLLGQETLTRTLKTAIRTKRLSQAYIFTGLHGTGKTSVARLLAKAVNCLGPTGEQTEPSEEPCTICENCRAIARGSFIDVIEIDAASNTGVQSIREVIEATQYSPIQGRMKVYIIDEVHMLSTAAFNALLKVIEEPPVNLMFLLATTDIHKVPLTILSRCQRYDLARVGHETLQKHFLAIAQQENFKLDEEAAALIAKAAAGSVRDGLSLLDQAIVQSQGIVTSDVVLDLLKITSRAVMLELMEQMLTQQTDAIFEKTQKLYREGIDFKLLFEQMLDAFYWMTRAKLGPQAIQEAPFANGDLESLSGLARQLTFAQLTRLWQLGLASLDEFSSGLSSRLVFDMLMIRLAYGANTAATAPAASVQPQAAPPAQDKRNPVPEPAPVSAPASSPVGQSPAPSAVDPSDIMGYIKEKLPNAPLSNKKD